METMKITWREILKGMCEDPQRKQEIASEVGFVSVRTLDRWIAGQSNPQKQDSIRRLAEISSEMLGSLQEEFPEAFQSTPARPIARIEHVTLPSEFYRRVVHAYGHVPLASRRWTVWHLVSNQMVPHLDVDRTGLMIVYVRFSNGTLYLEEGAGNGVWTIRQLAQHTLQDSWLVQVVAQGHPMFIQSCIAEQFPSQCILNAERIQSMGFFPLHRGGIPSGGLLFCAMTSDFFSPLRQDLIEQYTSLMALAFSDSDF